jgi:hypothetical protein
MPIWNNRPKNLQRFAICVNQNYLRRFIEVHNLVKKIKKRWARMGKCIYQFMSYPKEIEYFSEEKVTLFFLIFFACG